MKDYNNAVECGSVYKFIGKNGDDNKMVLVVSSNDHSTDKVISIIMLGTAKGTECIPVKLGGDDWTINCGMVTYTYRNYLGDKLYTLDVADMDLVKQYVASHFGFVADNMYKQLYENLLEKIVGGQSNE